MTDNSELNLPAGPTLWSTNCFPKLLKSTIISLSPLSSSMARLISITVTTFMSSWALLTLVMLWDRKEFVTDPTIIVSPRLFFLPKKRKCSHFNCLCLIFHTHDYWGRLRKTREGTNLNIINIVSSVVVVCHVEVVNIVIVVIVVIVIIVVILSKSKVNS